MPKPLTNTIISEAAYDYAKSKSSQDLNLQFKLCQAFIDGAKWYEEKMKKEEKK